MSGLSESLIIRGEAHKAVDTDGLVMNFATGCALDFEGVPEGITLAIIGAEIRDSVESELFVF